MIFFLTFALACSPQEKFNHFCEARCNYDQDKSWWVTKGKTVPYLCHCGNPVNMKNPNLKIPRNFKVETLTASEPYE